MFTSPSILILLISYVLFLRSCFMQKPKEDNSGAIAALALGASQPTASTPSSPENNQPNTGNGTGGKSCEQSSTHSGYNGKGNFESKSSFRIRFQ